MGRIGRHISSPHFKEANVHNVKVTVKENKLTVECDLSAEGKASSTGKTILVASTAGSYGVPGTDLKLGLNLFRPINSRPATA